MSDAVLHPEHYCRGDIEPLQFSRSNCLSFSEGSLVKYLYRWRFKHSDKRGKLQDLAKARNYLRMIIEDRQSEGFFTHPRPVHGIDVEDFIASVAFWTEDEASIIRAMYYGCAPGGDGQLLFAMAAMTRVIDDAKKPTH